MRRGWIACVVVVVAVAVVVTAISRRPSDSAASAPARSSTTTTSPPPTTTTPAVTTPRCPSWVDPAPTPDAAELTARLAPHLDDRRLDGNDVSVSVWVDGLGEVASLNGDTRLAPASNQKLFTAMGVLDALDHATTFRTTVRITTDGDLVLVGGGDPTLTSTGAHSLAALARAVRDAGITDVRGRVLADESRYDSARFAPGWQDWQIPKFVGPLSAVIVDDNRDRTDAAFIDDPAMAHAEEFRRALVNAGVAVSGEAASASVTADAHIVAEIESAPATDLVMRMLLNSDNEIAESLTREAGVLLSGVGSTSGGAAALEVALVEHCAPIAPGGWADGSGLSRSNQRSAREMRQLVQFARARSWWPDLESRLPVAGESGTLAGRLRGTAAQGRVIAKTGTIIGGGALTGVVQMASGREAVFSYLVNGDGSPAAVDALDELVVALAAQ